MLEVQGVSAGYLGEDVVHTVDIQVDSGETVAVIGSNGAGKSTLFKAICGMIPTSEGRITFDGEDFTRRPSHRIARGGIAYVPAERHLFPHMSVSENLSLGAYPGRSDSDTRDFVLGLFPRLGERLGQKAGTMSGGEQQMLAMGRALMARPRLLMLDEPTTGLAPILAQAAYEALGALRGSGLTVLLAEQQVPMALRLADRGYVLENGRIQVQGTSEELKSNPEVQRAYLGIA